MTRYNQGWSEQKRSGSGTGEVWGALLCGLALVILVGMVTFALAGCAGPLAVKRPLVEVRDHQTIRGLVRVAQMGVDCDEQEAFLKRVISDIIVGAGSPAPDKLDIRPLSGSSLCGMAQGMAEPVRMPDLGARYLAVAEVAAYWSAITYSELQKAHGALQSLAPTSPAKKPAITLRNK